MVYWLMQESGWDPEVKRYFRKIMNSFIYGLLWMLASATAGFYFKLALPAGALQWYNVLFYCLFAGSFLGLVWMYYRMWKGFK